MLDVVDVLKNLAQHGKTSKIKEQAKASLKVLEDAKEEASKAKAKLEGAQFPER